MPCATSVSYTHLRAHETVLDLVCRLLLEKKNVTHTTQHLPLDATPHHETVIIDPYHVRSL